jgi:hypothetical protein
MVQGYIFAEDVVIKFTCTKVVDRTENLVMSTADLLLLGKVRACRSDLSVIGSGWTF